jgi:hypothetical protein
MKNLITCILSLLLAQAVSAQRGGGYYTTAHATIKGTANWGTLQPSITSQNTYTITSGPTAISAVGISGDPQFSINSTGCVGSTACTATVSFNAPYGGDYQATVSASAASGNRIRAGSGYLKISAHVAGAAYTITAAPVVSNNNSDAPGLTATFTLSSTGETDLHVSGVTATDGYGSNGAHIESNTCVGTIARGTTCQIVVSYVISAGGDGSGYYSISVGVTGDTRPQPPLTIMGILYFLD